MNFAKPVERYEQAPVSSERTFPANPFPRTSYTYCASARERTASTGGRSTDLPASHQSYIIKYVDT